MEPEDRLLAAYEDSLAAQLMSAKLEANGVHAYVLDENSWRPFYYHRTPTPAKLYVRAKDCDRAAAILEEVAQTEAEARAETPAISLVCPLCGSGDIGPDPFRKWAMLLTILTLGLAFCLLFVCKQHECRQCGHRWRDGCR